MSNCSGPTVESIYNHIDAPDEVHWLPIVVRAHALQRTRWEVMYLQYVLMAKYAYTVTTFIESMGDDAGNRVYTP
jgi:hypothetical protein